MRYVWFSLAIAISLGFSGCATLFGGGGKQIISFNSEERIKATVTYSDGTGTQYFTTPATIMIQRRSEDLNITSDNDEFEPFVLESTLNGWFWVNILGIEYSLFSSTTDALTGAMWKYDEIVTVHKKQ